MVKLRYLLILAFVLPLCAVAQVEFSASVSSNVVNTGERITLEFTANARGQISYPDLTDFEILSGPMQSSQSSMTIINGQMSQNEKYTFRLIITPKKSGTLTIKPAQYQVGGKRYESNSITLQVSKGSDPVPANPRNLPDQPNTPMTAQMIVSKPSIYQGESITVLYKVYSKYEFHRIVDFKASTYRGFYTKEIDLNLKNNTYSVEVENVNGVQYFTLVMRKELLIAQESGKLTLEPFEIEMELIQGRGFFRSTFPARVKSNKVEIEVKKVPNPPADFSGMVGTLSIETNVSRTKLQSHEGFDYVVTLRGKGNIQFMDIPKLNLPDEFEVYDPEEESNIAVNNAGMSGSRTFRYFVIPRIHGEFELTPVQLSYFDPLTNSYQTLKSELLKLDIERGATPANLSSKGGQNGGQEEEVESLRYLATEYNMQSERTFLTREALFYALLAIPPVALALLLLFIRRGEKQPQEADYLSKAAREALKEARLALNDGKPAEFYTSLHHGLLSFAALRTGVGKGQTDKESVRLAMSRQGVSDELVSKFIKLLETCEMARFASLAPGSELQLISDAETLIAAVDKIKGGKS